MKIYYKLLFLAFLGLLSGGCESQPPESLFDADRSYTLRTIVQNNRMVYVGVDAEIAGVVNPDLVAERGETLHIRIVNGDNIPHNLSVPEVAIQSQLVSKIDEAVDLTFKVDESSRFSYFCSLSGHRQAGMEGTIVVR